MSRNICNIITDFCSGAFVKSFHCFFIVSFVANSTISSLMKSWFQDWYYVDIKIFVWDLCPSESAGVDVSLFLSYKIVSEYEQEIPQSQTADKPIAPRGRANTTIVRHQDDKLSKATSCLFPIKMIAKLEWTQSNTQQNIEQLHNPTMGAIINNESTRTEMLVSSKYSAAK